MARRVQELCAFVAERYGGDAAAVWTQAADAEDLRRRIQELPGFGEMKVKALGSVLAKRFGVAAAEGLVPDHKTLGDVDSPRGARDLPGGEARLQGRAQEQLSTEAASVRAGSPTIELTTLTDGGQSASAIAREAAAFLRGASRSLDLALYDVRLESDAGALVLAALLDAQQRGVTVRLLYNVDHPGPIPVPPPPETKPVAIEALPVETLGIPGIPDLMHHKFVVRDETDVWTGSTNWTDDSWERQENVIVRVLGAQQLAHAFRLEFDALWGRPDVEASGRVQPRPVGVGEAEVRPWFTPGHGEALSHRIAKHIGRARTRIRIASPVITSGPILGTLVEVVNESRCPVAGIVDDTQLDQVFHQWETNGVSAWKIPLLHTVLTKGEFSGKITTPWSPESVHDFMHAKVVVADDTAFVGSFNLSRSGERNAENVLEIRDASVADRVAAYVDEIRARYPRATSPGAAPPGRGSYSGGPDARAPRTPRLENLVVVLSPVRARELVAQRAARIHARVQVDVVAPRLREDRLQHRR